MRPISIGQAQGGIDWAEFSMAGLILMSGCADEMLVRYASASGSTVFIEKPKKTRCRSNLSSVAQARRN
jgi:hypothetical protein